MMLLIGFIICFIASAAGALCGIGGGDIIKPLLDAIGFMDVAAISFLSGCTVLSMSTYSVIQNGKVKRGKKELPIVFGAVLGGVLGKMLFQQILNHSHAPDKASMIQAICLFIVTAGTLSYTVFKDRIHTYHVVNQAAVLMIGLLLGMLSSFLGIGGGPINLVVLFFFFSMDTKTAAENSLYIIFFSQAASLIQTIVTSNVPDVSPPVLVVMVMGGLLGAVCGRGLSKRLNSRKLDRFLIILMVVLLVINFYNIYKFM